MNLGCAAVATSVTAPTSRVPWQVPIMLRSNYCSLAEKTDKDLSDFGECPYDQVRCPTKGADQLS